MARLATVTAVKPPRRFGELAMDGRPSPPFAEKPEQESAYISGGFMVLEPRIGSSSTAGTLRLRAGPDGDG